VESQALNLAILFEELAKLFLSDVLWETFHVEIASLLRIFVFDGVSQAFSLAVALLEGFFDVEFLVNEGNTIHHISIVEFDHSLLSARWSVLTVALVLRVEADECKGTFVIRFEVQTLDSTKFLENFPAVVFSEAVWEILGINVIVNSAEVAFVTWSILDCLVDVSLGVSLECLECTFRLLEAHEAIAARGMVGVKGNFE